MSFRHVDLLEVRAFGQMVGAVAPSPTIANTYVFEYASTWRDSGIDLAPLLMPTNQQSIFTFSGLSQETYKGLPPMLADSLPDKFGNSLVDAELARQQVPTNRISPLDRLAYIGTRGMGALEFQPAVELTEMKATSLDLADLVVAARAALNNSIEESGISGQTLSQIVQIGTSAGGARAKAVVDFHPKTKGLAISLGGHKPGYEPWILKFDGVGANAQLRSSQQDGRIEYAYSLMAKSAGIQMTPTYLLEEDGRAHFMTKRFDRSVDGHKLHMQSLCAIDAIDFKLTGTNAYEQLFNVIVQLELGEDAMTEAWRRAVFNVYAANCDDHSKNFSFLMNATGEWSLAPANDLTFAYDPTDYWTNKHLMSIRGEFSKISDKHLLDLAEMYGIFSAKRIMREVAEAVGDWAAFAADAGVSTSASKQIQGYLVK